MPWFHLASGAKNTIRGDAEGKCRNWNLMHDSTILLLYCDNNSQVSVLYLCTAAQLTTTSVMRRWLFLEFPRESFKTTYDTLDYVSYRFCECQAYHSIRWVVISDNIDRECWLSAIAYTGCLDWTVVSSCRWCT